MIKGWADSRLLDAHEIERQPITEQVSRHAMNLALTWSHRYGSIPDAIEQPGPEGDAARDRIGQQACKIIVAGMCCGDSTSDITTRTPDHRLRRRGAAQLYAL